MERHYEVFFDSRDLRDERGESEVVLGNDVYVLCSQTYHVRVDEQELEEIGLDPERGISDVEEMTAYLEAFHPQTQESPDDLLNCVSDCSLGCIFAIRETDEDEYLSFVG